MSFHNFLQIISICLWLAAIVEMKNDRIKLKDVQTLTLYSDKWTTSRRGSPIKQLNCVGGYCKRARIDVAQCYNRGSDGRDIQWECNAQLPSDYKLGRLDVSCEGYDYPDDDYILAGSCGLEYTIVETDGAQQSSYNIPKFDFTKKDSLDSFSWTTVITIIIIIVIIYYTCIRDENTASSSSSDYPRPGGGGGGFFSSSSAPPPPGFRSDFFGGGSGDSCSGNSSRSTSGPGFWSGMAAGGLMGYLFGSSPSNQRYGSRTSSYWGMPSTSSGIYSSYSGGGGSTRSRSSETSTSTGFASTSRR